MAPLTRAQRAAVLRMHAERAAQCLDVETALSQYTQADLQLPDDVPFFPVDGCQKFADELMRIVYEGAYYEVLFYDCQKRGYVTFAFGQIQSVIKTTDTMEEALNIVGQVLNEALYEMMKYGDSMFRLPDKRLLWYPEGEEATLYTAQVPVRVDSPARLQRSDLVPFTRGE